MRVMAREPPALHVVAPLDTPAPESPDPRSLDLDTLFRRYSSYVAAVAHRLLGRDDEVDDTVQEVFLAAVRGLRSVRDPQAVKSWLACIAVRVARRKLRKRRMRSFFGLDDPATYGKVTDPGASPEQRALLERVYRVLDEMPTNDRVAWALRYVEGEPLESVASLSGCSLATAKRRIRAASRTIEEAFSDG
ncbi:MAG TPA: sigma-70 family RNA polymerase sigma factor [Polyangiaceae bacterium]|nr:sigma-70 family RNA polymerase sigma factor [Polyangiaceae bacterium]